MAGPENDGNDSLLPPPRGLPGGTGDSMRFGAYIEGTTSVSTQIVRHRRDYRTQVMVEPGFGKPAGSDHSTGGLGQSQQQQQGKKSFKPWYSWCLFRRFRKAKTNYNMRRAPQEAGGSNHSGRNEILPDFASASMQRHDTMFEHDSGIARDVASSNVNARQRVVELCPCAVCGEDKTYFEVPAHTPTTRCSHPVQTCGGCVHQWLSTSIESGNWNHIKCPSLDCDQILEYNDVDRSATFVAFATYDGLYTRDALSRASNFAWCLAVGCDSGQHFDSGTEALMQCTDCGYKQCLKHRTAWHVGETCKQFDQRSSQILRAEQNRLSEDLIRSKMKKCPGYNCAYWIQKRSGCNHMTCQSCRHQFCWICLAPYGQIRAQGNAYHRNWCRFHTSNLADVNAEFVENAPQENDPEPEPDAAYREMLDEEYRVWNDWARTDVFLTDHERMLY